MKEEHAYKSETDLCRDFIAWAKLQGWVAYAETAGFDILLVGAGGVQIGVQAKLRFNATLLRQILPSSWSWDGDGPDYRAVLLPSATHDIAGVCDAIGVITFRPRGNQQVLHIGSTEEDYHSKFFPMLKIEYFHHYWNPMTRCVLPEYVPDVAAGASCPIQLTEWKIAALRVCAMLEIHGEVTTKQIKEFGIDPRRWAHSAAGWLQPVHMKRGYYQRGPKLLFAEQHPTVYAQIKSELIAAESKAAS